MISIIYIFHIFFDFFLIFLKGQSTLFLLLVCFSTKITESWILNSQHHWISYLLLHLILYFFFNLQVWEIVKLIIHFYFPTQVWALVSIILQLQFISLYINSQVCLIWISIQLLQLILFFIPYSQVYRIKKVW